MLLRIFPRNLLGKRNALLDRGLSEIEPGTEVVLISTRESDLSDRERFPGLAADAARRSRLRRLRTINTASDELNEYFQAR